MFEHVDWSHRGLYMKLRHGIEPQVANDALSDPDRVVIDPDYNSISGRSVRIIGFSVLVQDVITVIVVENDWIGYGVNKRMANEKDRRLYRTRGEEEPMPAIAPADDLASTLDRLESDLMAVRRRVLGA